VVSNVEFLVRGSLCIPQCVVLRSHVVLITIYICLSLPETWSGVSNRSEPRSDHADVINTPCHGR
jgi:hypothetical protein